MFRREGNLIGSLFSFDFHGLFLYKSFQLNCDVEYPYLNRSFKVIVLQHYTFLLLTYIHEPGIFQPSVFGDLKVFIL